MQMLAVDEQKVLITPDGLGRAAIVRRGDGLYCLYQHWLWPKAVVLSLGWDASGMPERWDDGSYDRQTLYNSQYAKPPEDGLFGTVEDAELEVRGWPGFADAVPESHQSK